MTRHLTLPCAPFTRGLGALLLAALLGLAAAGCTKKDQVSADLLALNAAGRAATQQNDLQQAMGRARSASTPVEKARILREAGGKLVKARTDLLRVDIKSPEVKDLQTRLAAMFGQVGEAASAAATALETSDAPGLERASRSMQQSQGEIMSIGQDMARLAKERDVDLNKL